MQQQITDEVGIDQASVTRKIDEIMQNGQLSDSHIFRNFEDDERKLYTIWIGLPRAREYLHLAIKVRVGGGFR